MKTQKTIKFILGFFLLTPVLALAYPGIPHQFYGTVNFANETPALDGTTIEAKINGVLIESNQTKDGKYGYNPNLFYVTDPDRDQAGEEVEFFVNGLDSEISATFSNGKIEKLDLELPDVKIGSLENELGSVITDETVVVVPDNPTIMKIGEELEVSLSPTGTSGTNAVVDKIEKLADNFFTGATGVLSGNTVLNAYEIKVTGDDLNISITMEYDDSLVDESTVKPYIFDGSDWVAITPFTIDKVGNKITFSISSANTPYAVFGETLPEDSTPPASGGSGGGGGGFIASNTSTNETTDEDDLKTGDINGNNTVDKYDFALMMSAWGQTGSGLTADINNDGVVNKYDFSLLMVNWSL